MERKLAVEFQKTIEQMEKTFIHRRDMFPSQLDDGSYICVREPLTKNHLRLHLEGNITLGTYVLDMESTAKFMVLDADNEQGFDDLKELVKILQVEGISTYLETSRRGGHLWFFFGSPKPGEEVRAFGKGIFETFKLEGLELYPKQEKVREGPGSCIRLPFGLHRLTGKRYPFVDGDGTLLAPSIREQITLLANAKTVSDEIFRKYKARAPQKEVKPIISNGNGEALWERIKERAPAIDFIGAFVPLKKTASGGVGKCPFHDDQHESFGVNAKENYWYCFAGCGGGSIIDFWMMWRNYDFKTAVEELENLLL